MDYDEWRMNGSRPDYYDDEECECAFFAHHGNCNCADDAENAEYERSDALHDAWKEQDND